MSSKIPALFFTLLVILLASFTARAQNFFVARERPSFFRLAGILNSKEDTLQKEFQAKGLEWPAKYVYVRSFKYDAQLEVWVKNTTKEKYKLFKTYKVCMQSGTMGPKRLQGDYQVPEGFYYINEFNAHSNYHLALGLNYPNVSDRILSDSLRPGNAIYIHGSCVSVGCIPVTDEDIEEIFLIASYAKANGEDFIPVHVFPFRYNSRRSLEYFKLTAKNNPALQKFAMELKDAYDKFEETRQVPLVLIDRKGDYIID
jgi:murein L,D-transpeptidase YafK